MNDSLYPYTLKNQMLHTIVAQDRRLIPPESQAEFRELCNRSVSVGEKAIDQLSAPAGWSEPAALLWARLRDLVPRQRPISHYTILIG